MDKKVFFTQKKPKKRDMNIVHYGFDIETTGKKNEFILACISNSERTYVYRDSKTCIRELMNEPQFADVCLIATNLKFDFFGLVQRFVMELGTKHMKLAEKDGRIYRCVLVRPDGKTIEFRDTMNYWVAGVVKLGDALHLPKMEHPSFFPNAPRNEDEWKELTVYCENDAKISVLWYEQFVLTMCDQYGIVAPLTAASMALAIFQTNYLEYNFLEVPTHNQWQFIRQSYLGGRTEVIRRGVVPAKVDCYDINSSYPGSMANNVYPNPSRRHDIAHGSPWIIENKEGFSYVEGYMPDEIFLPVLGVKIMDKLIFPTGWIKGVYTHVELRQAIKDGFRIETYGRCIYYTKTCAPFADFIHEFYDKRKELKKKKDPMENMYKIMLNSSYGKFGFNYMESNSIVTSLQLSEEKLGEITKITGLAYDFFSITCEDSQKQVAYALIEWASYITAYARLHLLTFMREHQDYLLYVDTDSLYLMDGHAPVPNNDVLDAFKFEKDCPPNQSIFIAPKHYRFVDDIKIKGIKVPKLQKDGKNREERDILWLSSITGKEIAQEQFASYRRVLRSKEHHKNGILAFNEIIDIKKILKTTDTKRQWGKTLDVTQLETSKPKSLTHEDWRTHEKKTKINLHS